MVGVKKLITIIALTFSIGAWSSNLLEGTAFINANTNESFKFLEGGNFSASLKAKFDSGDKHLAIEGYYSEWFSEKSKSEGKPINRLYVTIYFDSFTCNFQIEEKGDYYWFDVDERAKTVSNMCTDLLVKQIVPIDKEKHLKIN